MNSATWSPDGRLLVTTSADGTAKVWDATNGQERLTLRGHGDEVLGAAWSPDGRRSPPPERTGTARVWAVVSAPERLILPAQAKTLLAIAPSPDRRYILADGADNTAQICGMRKRDSAANPARA